MLAFRCLLPLFGGYARWITWTADDPPPRDLLYLFVIVHWIVFSKRTQTESHRELESCIALNDQNSYYRNLKDIQYCKCLDKDTAACTVQYTFRKRQGRKLLLNTAVSFVMQRQEDSTGNEKQDRTGQDRTGQDRNHVLVPKLQETGTGTSEIAKVLPPPPNQHSGKQALNSRFIYLFHHRPHCTSKSQSEISLWIL